MVVAQKIPYSLPIEEILFETVRLTCSKKMKQGYLPRTPIKITLPQAHLQNVKDTKTHYYMGNNNIGELVIDSKGRGEFRITDKKELCALLKYGYTPNHRTYPYVKALPWQPCDSRKDF